MKRFSWILQMGPAVIMITREIQEDQSQRECDGGNKVRGRFEDASLLVLRMEEEAMDQRMQAASRSWKINWILS